MKQKQVASSESKYCKFCETEHPLNNAYWRYTGGWQCRARGLQKAREWRARNVEKRREIGRRWSALNRDRRNAYKQERIRTDVNFRLAHNLRVRTNRLLRGQKLVSAVRDLGCSLDLFKQHLEEQFTSEMNWNNYGTVWHIDHILPLANYQLSDRGTFRRLVHYTNLQPLLVRANLSKSNRE